VCQRNKMEIREEANERERERENVFVCICLPVCVCVCVFASIWTLLPKRPEGKMQDSQSPST